MQKAKLLKDLETPHAIREILRSVRGLRRESRTRLERDLKLSYHFGGMDVACKETKDGLAIYASGPGQEVSNVLDRLSKQARAQLTILFPDRWEDMLDTVVRHRSHRTG